MWSALQIFQANGLNHRSRGQRPRNIAPHFCFALKGQAKNFSIPQIPFVVRRVIFFEHPQKFLLKGFFFVMRFLVENIFAHRLEMRRADAEQTIAVLPMKSVQLWIQCLHKLRRIFFDNFQNFGRWKFFGEIAQNVNMVGDAANRDGIAFQILKNLRLIRPDSLANVRRQPRAAFFGRENDMRAQDIQ